MTDECSSMIRLHYNAGVDYSPEIYPLPDYTQVSLDCWPELYLGVNYGGSQNLPLPPRI